MSMRQKNSLARAQHGMTLVELMVALVIGLLLLAGVIQIFLSNRAAFSFNEGLARLQENGRFATDTLSTRARMAGYLGCLSGVPVSNNLDASNPLAFDLEQGLFGYEAAGTAPDDEFEAADVNPANSSDATDWVGSLDAELVGDVIPGSDVLIIRNASPESYTLLTPFNDTDMVYVDAASTAFAVGGIGVVSDCQKASVFQLTSVANEASGISLAHTGGAWTPGNALAAWDTDQLYAAGAEMRLAETWIYYVGAGSNGAPALFQRRLQLTGTTVDLVAEEVVESVDTMQVLYGVDAAGDGAVDGYVTADAVTDWNTVASVRVGLLLRAPDEYGNELDTQVYNVNETLFDPVDDRRVREVFTTTIAIRNRLP